MSDLRVIVDGIEFAAEWTERNPETRAAIEAALPLSGEATRWGDELYFTAGLDRQAESPQTELPVGAIAYWPDGDAVCLFWGPTPASRDEEPRAAAPVDVVARLEETRPLESIEGGTTVRIERLDDSS